MALPTQRGLLFHRRNRLSRTNCCFQLASMVAENHIIIQQQWMAENCSASGGVFPLFLNAESQQKVFAWQNQVKHVGLNFLTCPCYGCVSSGVQMRHVIVRINPYTAHVVSAPLYTCFPSFVNDFSPNLSCTRPKKSVPGGTFTSTFTLCPFQAQFWLFNWKLHFTNEILDEKIQQECSEHPVLHEFCSISWGNFRTSRARWDTAAPQASSGPWRLVFLFAASHFATPWRPFKVRRAGPTPKSQQLAFM